ncbi:MAG: OadG family protein [Magnetococcales bacterium]|nr:OadG family protein [Magnetococcales bacterium]
MSELMSKGIELMFLGMGTVFVFLAVLVFAVSKMSELAQKFEKSQPQPQTSQPTMAATNNDHIAAISAAVHQYRSKHK